MSGDEVVSLENAFIYAGSPAVVATLWSVADQSTAALMVKFYQKHGRRHDQDRGPLFGPTGHQKGIPSPPVLGRLHPSRRLAIDITTPAGGPFSAPAR